MAQCLEALGHEVIVADPTEAPMDAQQSRRVKPERRAAEARAGRALRPGDAPKRRQAKGPRPKPRWMPLPQRLSAQVVKSYRCRRVVGVKHHVVFGGRENIASILAKRGWQINTSCVERLNLAFRQHVAAIGRRVQTLGKHEAALRQQLVRFRAYHTFGLPHASLRVPLPDPMHRVEAVKAGSRGHPRWQPG